MWISWLKNGKSASEGFLFCKLCVLQTKGGLLKVAQFCLLSKKFWHNFSILSTFDDQSFILLCFAATLISENWAAKLILSLDGLSLSTSLKYELPFLASLLKCQHMIQKEICTTLKFGSKFLVSPTNQYWIERYSKSVAITFAILWFLLLFEFSFQPVSGATFVIFLLPP